jgi:hypothetical protein
VFSGIDLRDRHYTQGLHIRVGYVEGKLPRLLTAAVAVLPARIRRLCGSGECNGGFEFGQSIYTPQNIRRPLFPPYDRPYGAWLYGGALLQARELGHVLHTFSADAGVVGPQAYGKEIQTWWHVTSFTCQPRLDGNINFATSRRSKSVTRSSGDWRRSTRRNKIGMQTLPYMLAAP